MAYLMGNLVSNHLNATVPWRTSTTALPFVRSFVEQHKLLTGMMGDLHDEVFVVVKQNGYTYDDIRAARKAGGGAEPYLIRGTTDGEERLR